MKKRCLAMVLALALCLGLAAPALAADYTEVVPCIYGETWGFSEGLAAVWLNGKWGYIDKTGREIVPCIYDFADSFSEGLAEVKLNGKWGYIDTTGREVVPCKYDAALSFSEGLAQVKLNGKYGYIDKTGKEVVPCKYSEVGSFSEGLAAVELNGKCGYIDETGREVVPCKYSEAVSFSEGLAAVRLNGKWGYIDKTGREIVPCIYDFADSFSEGLAEVELNGKWGFISVGGVSTPQQPANVAYASTQSILVDGKTVEFQCYALKDANGNDTNYVKLRDVASILNGTAVQFNVGWDGTVNIETGKGYTPNGSEMNTPFYGDRAYENATAATNIDGKAASLDAIVLKDDQGGAYTYYKLRDLGAALGFKVDWTAEKGIFIETK